MLCNVNDYDKTSGVREMSRRFGTIYFEVCLNIQIQIERDGQDLLDQGNKSSKDVGCWTLKCINP